MTGVKISRARSCLAPRNPWVAPGVENAIPRGHFSTNSLKVAPGSEFIILTPASWRQIWGAFELKFIQWKSQRLSFSAFSTLPSQFGVVLLWFEHPLSCKYIVCYTWCLSVDISLALIDWHHAFTVHLHSSCFAFHVQMIIIMLHWYETAACIFLFQGK